MFEYKDMKDGKSKKFRVETSQYIPSRGFVISICTEFDFFDEISKSVILYLKDGKQYQGTLVGGRFWIKDGKEVWGLVIKPNEIQNPEAANLVSIELR